MKKIDLILVLRSSPSCVHGRPLQLCAQRVFVRKGTAAKCAARVVRKELQLIAQLDLKERVSS